MANLTVIESASDELDVDLPETGYITEDGRTIIVPMSDGGALCIEGDPGTDFNSMTEDEVNTAMCDIIRKFQEDFPE